MSKRLKTILKSLKKFNKKRHPFMDLIIKQHGTNQDGTPPPFIEGRYREFEDPDKIDFKNCEIFFKLTFPNNFPLSPPNFYIYTPNGVYGVSLRGGADVEKLNKICISIGSFHSSSYPVGKGLDGFAEEVLNGLICWRELGEGIRIIRNKTDKSINKFSKASKAFNSKHLGDLKKEFETLPWNMLHQTLCKKITVGEKIKLYRYVGRNPLFTNIYRMVGLL